MLTSYLSMLPETGRMGGYIYAAGFEAEDAQFLLPLFDGESGQLLALLDGASMNPYKTGAVGAVGVDALARKDVSTLAVIGSGPQARGQVASTATVRSFDTVRVYSPTAANRKAFAAEMSDRIGVSVEPVESSETAVRGADVVITATNATEPVFDGEGLEPGTHVTAMGQYDRGVREIDTTTVARAKYVTDLEERATNDAGAFLQAIEEDAIDESHLHGDLGAVLSGAVDGRTSPEEITVFDSGGTGVETVAVASMLYDRAQEEGLGTEIEISAASDALDGR